MPPAGAALRAYGVGREVQQLRVAGDEDQLLLAGDAARPRRPPRSPSSSRMTAEASLRRRVVRHDPLDDALRSAERETDGVRRAASTGASDPLVRLQTAGTRDSGAPPASDGGPAAVAAAPGGR